MEDSRARKFLVKLDEAAHKRDDHPAQKALLQELLSSLWWGELLGAGELHNLDEEQREILAIAKLETLIELVVTIRMAWINSPVSMKARSPRAPPEGARRRYGRTGARILPQPLHEQPRVDERREASGVRPP